jgi:hypothetical protein
MQIFTHELADEISNSPSSFKLCVGCEAIIPLITPVCPYCHSYRFIKDEKAIIDRMVDAMNDLKEPIDPEGIEI